MTGEPDPLRATELLARMRNGDERAREELLESLYADLRRMASAQLQGESPGHTLQPTALVNEVYLRVFAASNDLPADSRASLMATAARAMRHVLVDHARSRGAMKRGAGARREPLDELVLSYEERGLELTALEEVLKKLEQMDPELSRIVEMRFFAGYTQGEIAETLGKSERSIERGWATARAFLQAELGTEA